MTMARITRTVDAATLAELKERVAPGKVSACVVEALRRKLGIDPIVEPRARVDVTYGDAQLQAALAKALRRSHVS